MVGSSRQVAKDPRTQHFQRQPAPVEAPFPLNRLLRGALQVSHFLQGVATDSCTFWAVHSKPLRNRPSLSGNTTRLADIAGNAMVRLGPGLLPPVSACTPWVASNSYQDHGPDAPAANVTVAEWPDVSLLVSSTKWRRP